MSWLHRHRHHQPPTSSSSGADQQPPPNWTPAAERSRTFGILCDAPESEYQAAEEFCKKNPVVGARLLTSMVVEQIRAEGCKAWELTPPRQGSRFRGKVEVLQSTKEGGPKVIKISSEESCGDFCLMSNLPLMAGLYGIQGKEGVYYEIKIKKMGGIIAVGTACQPYPEYRLPGWNRLSAGLHLDDLQKFYEDPDGGRRYDNRLKKIRPGDVIGCGYEFKSRSLFFTYNGLRLDNAFGGIYAPRSEHDVYAAIGVGGINELIVNFGGDDQEHLFRWKPGREWAWLVDGHVGRLGEGSGGDADELPTYEQAINK